jgi:hypothetical protein
LTFVVNLFVGVLVLACVWCHYELCWLIRLFAPHRE